MPEVAVVLGATGFVGQGAALAFLRDGMCVACVGREQEKLEKLQKILLAKVPDAADRLKLAVGDFSTDEKAKETAERVRALVGQWNHVVSNLGFGTLVKTSSLETPSSVVTGMIDNEFLLNYRAAAAFLPSMKKLKGSSFTVMSGGTAHHVYGAYGWTASFKNGLMNHWVTVVLADDTKDDDVRCNVACIHMAVTDIGGSKNQAGFAATDSEHLGPFFVGLAHATNKSECVCIADVKTMHTLFKH